MEEKNKLKYIKDAVKVTGDIILDNISENFKLKSENVKLSSNVGFSKFKDFLAFMGIREGSGFIGREEDMEEYRKEYENFSEQAKQDVLEARAERDSFYVANSEKLNFVDTLVGGLVESITNPFEVALQVGVGIATGGTSIPVQIGAQVGVDVAQITGESLRYDDRLPTGKELALTGAMSIAPDLLFMGAGNLIRRNKSGIANSVKLGDNVIDVRNEINVSDSIMRDTMSKPQQMYTDYKVGSDSVYMAGGSSRDPFNNFIKEISQEGIKPNKYLNLYSDSFNSKPVNDTVLGRYTNKIEGVSSVYNEIYKDLELTGNDFELSKNLFNPKKTKIQNLQNINKKLNPIIDDLIEGTMPTVNDYVSRWEIKANKTKQGEKIVSPSVNYSQIDTTLNSIDTKYNTQRMYAQNEYIQKLGETPNDFLNKVGSENKDMVVKWLDNNFDSSQDGYDFFKSARTDSVQLDELKMGVSLYDISDFENFHKQYGRSFDVDQNIVYDNVLLETIISAKNKPNDLSVLKRAMYDNPKEYVNFITEMKDNIQNIKGRGQKFAKEFINEEFDNITKGVDFSKGSKVWKKEVAEGIAKRKKVLAEESIKINQTINKQSLLGDFDKYYDNKISKDNVGSVKLSQEGEIRFNNEIKPLYDNGILKVPEDGNYSKHFANLTLDIKKTRNSARWTGEYKTIGELRDFFNEGKMTDFFTQVNDGKHLKTNGQLIRDIFDRQTGDIARFIEYGSTSPFVLKNRVNFELKKVASSSKFIGKELSDAQKVVYQTIIDRTNNMLTNTQTGATRLLQTQTEKVLKKSRNVIRRGILSLTGASELYVQNYAIATMRAQKYGGAKAYVNNPVYQAKKMLRGVKRDLPNAKYNIAQITKDTDLSYLNNTVSQKLDNFAMYLQDYSAKQMKRYGEAHATSILHNLPKDYNLVENELKDLLKKNGIDEINYSSLKDFAKKHIDENGLTVNMNLLSASSEMGNDMAYNLVNSYYQLADDIGNPMSKSKMKSNVAGEIEQWYGMFKTFSRNLNTDTIGRVMNYTNVDGLSKSRLNLSQYKKDFGYKGMSKETGLFATGLTSLAIGGYAYTQLKEITQSNRSLDQKLAIMEVKNKEIVDAIKENPEDLILLMGKYSSLNPLELVESANIPKSIWNSATKIYKTFTDEEKQIYGSANVTEGTNMLVNEMLKYTVSRVALNVYDSTKKTVTDDDIFTLDKVYGLNAEQQREYESIVRNMNYESLKVGLMEERAKIKADTDMLEGNTETYSKLEPQVKDLFEQSMNDNNIEDSDKLGLRTEFAVISKASKNIDDLIEATQIATGINMRPTKEIMETKEYKPNNKFETLPKKKKNYFYFIMAHKGISNPSKEDYDLYVDNFKNASGSSVTKALKKVYNINRNEFVEIYKSDEMRRTALNIYR